MKLPVAENHDFRDNFRTVFENTRLLEVYCDICEKYTLERENLRKKYDVKELLERIRAEGYET